MSTWSWDALAAGTELPEVTLDITEQTVILVPVSTWDLFPGHHSPDYARSQGQQDMYLNTIALQGLADRSVSDVLGPETWVVRRKLAMLDSAYPGDRLTGGAKVVAVRREGAGIEADFVLDMATSRGPALRAELTARPFTPSAR
jgi:hypothetical protein